MPSVLGLHSSVGRRGWDVLPYRSRRSSRTRAKSNHGSSAARGSELLEKRKRDQEVVVDQSRWADEGDCRAGEGCTAM